MALMTTRDLSVGYDGHCVARDISFTVSKGDYLCIVGENGSGKSTLMKTILGLLPPLSGGIEMGEGLRQQAIGYVPQQTAAQRDFPASVREVVRSGCVGRMGARPFFSPTLKKTADDNMRRLDILPLAGRSYRELSGGQQQRVLLARALCAADRMLLMDEPTAGLDIHITEEMYGIISDLNKSGMTIVMISHDIDNAMKYASHILHVAKEPLYWGPREGYDPKEVLMKMKSRGERA